MRPLHELDFTDIYIRIDERVPSRYAPTQRRDIEMPLNDEVPEEFDYEINQVRTMVSKQEDDEFGFDLDRMRLRGCRVQTFGDEVWAGLRRLPLKPPRLSELGFTLDIVTELRALGRRNGLILVGGATGAGKTTTAVGILNEFLAVEGGVAVTIEDPVEFFLQGSSGNNLTIQLEAHSDEDWGALVKKSMRLRPRYISLGELRTPAAAKWLLRASTSGHLTICTVHGGSIEETLSAVLQIARTELGETAPLILAGGICAVIHQTLVNNKPMVQILTTNTSQADEVRVAIRSEKLQTLSTVIERQAVLRKMNKPIPDTTARQESTQRVRPQGNGSGSRVTQNTPSRNEPNKANVQGRSSPTPSRPWWKFW